MPKKLSATWIFVGLLFLLLAVFIILPPGIFGGAEWAGLNYFFIGFWIILLAWLIYFIVKRVKKK